MRIYQGKTVNGVRLKVELKRNLAKKFYAQSRGLGFKKNCHEVLKKEIKNLSRCQLLAEHRKFLISEYAHQSLDQDRTIQTEVSFPNVQRNIPTCSMCHFEPVLK